MASRIFKSAKCYGRNWSALTSHFRRFCNTNQEGTPVYIPTKQPVVIDRYGEFPVGRYVGSWPDFPLQSLSSEAAADWPDVQLGILQSPSDHKFPFPGFVGPNVKIPSSISLNNILTEEEVNGLFPTQFDKHDSVIANLQAEMESKNLRPVECVANTSNSRIMKELQPLFPDRKLPEDITVITMSQKTDNDMTTWNNSVEEEREQLLESFIEGAQDICRALESSGYWADFIDPASGKPVRIIYKVLQL
ncbi:DgyrCDS11275 [Dimorphilus gyrociliatus]|uniref:DgyrCDS11275 n=1 Tax=Dimorphilus gyrociliatus TaxID=2664684 RepID=A0A7I8W7N0_9ANNE|nr:DgyrCDS11275 [Dimorphilus gyrociliatus]